MTKLFALTCILALSACANPEPILLTGQRNYIVIDGAYCTLANPCIKHSDIVTGTIYHLSMVKQPDNEAKHVEFFNDTVRLTP